MKTMDTKHTPGPWRVGLVYPGDKAKHIVSEPVQKEVATVRALPEREFNLRLIAAAPELLELARQIVLESEDNKAIPADIVAGARAAIARAEGR